MANRNTRQKIIRSLEIDSVNLEKIKLHFLSIAELYSDVKPEITFWYLSLVDMLEYIVEINEKARREI